MASETFPPLSSEALRQEIQDLADSDPLYHAAKNKSIELHNEPCYVDIFHHISCLASTMDYFASARHTAIDFASNASGDVQNIVPKGVCRLLSGHTGGSICVWTWQGELVDGLLRTLNAPRILERISEQEIHGFAFGKLQVSQKFLAKLTAENEKGSLGGVTSNASDDVSALFHYFDPSRSQEVIVVGSEDCFIRVWAWDGVEGTFDPDFEDNPLLTFRPHADKVLGCLGTDDWLICSGDRTITMCSWSDGFSLKEISIPGRSRALSLSADCKFLAVGCDTGELHALKLSRDLLHADEFLFSGTVHEDYIRDIVGFPLGFVTASDDSEMARASWLGEIDSARVRGAHSDWIVRLAATHGAILTGSRDGGWAVLSWTGDVLMKFDGVSGDLTVVKTQWSPTLPRATTYGIALNPEYPGMFATGGRDDTIRIWSIPTQSAKSARKR